MMSSFQRVLIIIFVCIAVILISGVLLSQYLSSQILELRKELSFQNNDSKYSLQANLAPVAERLAQNGLVSNQNAESGGKIKDVFNNSLLLLTKVKKRSKRRVNSEEHFNWNFNFNLTRQRNPALQGSSEIALNSSHSDKNLDIAIFTEGGAKKKTAFAEIQHSLRAVEYFFSFLFNGGNITNEEETKNEVADSDMNLARFDGNESSARVREGKFFNLGALNIFGFRRSPDKAIFSTVPSMPETDSVFKKDVLLTTQSPSTDIAKQHEVNLSSFEAQSLMSEEFKEVNKRNLSSFNLPGKTEDGECIDCDAVGLESANRNETTDQSKDDQSEISITSDYTDEFLEMFCMRLVNKVGVSQHIAESNFEPKQNATDEHILRSNDDPDLDAVSEKELKNQSANEDTNVTRNKSLSDDGIRQQKFFNFGSFLEFGSGRAADHQNESNELTSENFVDLENLPTLVDCENYFRRKNLKMFPKPNLMDIISDPKIKFADFGNATISSNLIEQQLQFLTGLLKTNLDSGETFGKNAVGAMNESVSEGITVENESLITNLQKDRFVSVLGFASGNDESRLLRNEILNTARKEIGSGDLRSLNDIGKNEFGSGDLRSLNDIGKNEFGSGDLRSLNDIDKNEFGSGDLRSLNDIDKNEFGSGDLRSLWAALFGTDKNELGSGNVNSRGLTVFVTDRNEFENGDSRSLGATILQSNINEFGSGEFKSLDAVVYDAGRNEFGSGLRTFQDTVLNSQINEFGSGESRLLGTAISETDMDEFSGSRSLGKEIFETGISELSAEFKSLDTTYKPDMNKFGSGLRSFEGTIFPAQINELGSGESRLLEAIIPETDTNEFNRSRSLGIDTFESFLNDFENTSWRSLEVTTVKTEFGESGEFRSHDDATLGIEMDEFGSGNMRSLEIAETDTERNEFGSGNSFKTSDSFEDLNSVSMNKQRFLSVLGSTLGLTSGEGRDLSENLEIPYSKCENCSQDAIDKLHECDDSHCNYGNSNESINLTEDNFLIKKDCHGECSDSVIETRGEFNISSDHRLDCPDCNNNSFKEVNKSITVRNDALAECDECNFITSDAFNKSVRTLVGESEVLATNQVAPDKIAETSSVNTNIATMSENDSEKQNEIESPLEQTTEKNTQRFLGPVFLTGSGDGGLFGEDSGRPINLLEDRISVDNIEKGIESTSQIVTEDSADTNNQRFLGPIFLTGSGDGGLFEDSGGPINLLEEEESTVKSQNFSLRRARLDDIPLNVSDSFHGGSLKQSQQIEHPVNITEYKIISAVIPSRSGRLDDTTDVLCDDCNYEDFIENLRIQNFFNKDASEIEKRTNSDSDRKIPHANEKNIKTASFNVVKTFTDLAKESSFHARPCSAARECNVTLNERCITINSSRICGCSKGYVRNKETRKCVVKKIVETSIKLPAETFEEDLKNQFSRSFQDKRKSSIELVILLLHNEPELLNVLSEIELVKFSSGSLVITLNLIFAAENKSEAQLVKHVEDNLHRTLRDETLMNTVPLNINEATLVSVNGDVDYCKSSEFNYCSENAYCVSNPALPASYSCHCKEHYRDVSYDSRHIGEACIAKCPGDYCGPYGHCELLANDERVCLCSGLYFGRRCEVPGLYVLIALTFVGFISLTMLFIVVFKRRCSGFSYPESQAHGTESGMNPHMNDRVSDAIALEENIGAMKFISISTPLPRPAIKITRPTVGDSSNLQKFYNRNGQRNFIKSASGESGSSYEFDSTFDSTQSTRKIEMEANSTV